MTGWRLPAGGRIDRDARVDFEFDGTGLQGYAGDTVASALLASGQMVVGRSFKYHRPRGIRGAGVEEPNAFVDITIDGVRTPNVRATTTQLESGMLVSSVNTRGTARADRYGFLDRLQRFLPAGFYYKTFIWPDWARWEPSIRDMAGLGRLDAANRPPADCPGISAECRLLVIGGGPAGLSAAAVATGAGFEVILVDDGMAPGGSLDWMDAESNDWIDRQCRTIREGGGRILTGTTVWGRFDHGLFAAWENRWRGGDRLWTIRASHVLVATGAIERPLWFGNNDLPGIMSADAALKYLNLHAVAPGKDIIVATTCDEPYQMTAALAKAGCRVRIVDFRESPGIAAPRGIERTCGERVISATGAKGIRKIRTTRGVQSCDCLLVSGGYSPSLHLAMHGGGRVSWNQRNDALLADCPPGSPIRVIGGAHGTGTIKEAIDQGRLAGGDLDIRIPPGQGYGPACEVARPDTEAGGRIWVDFQNDVTLADLGLAVQEGYSHTEHAKRYTTLGMALDQGKTSGFAGQSVLAALTGSSPGVTGTTTFRPPWIPVPLPVIAGLARRDLFDPLKRLALESAFRAEGAQFDEYGGWLRPACFGAGEIGKCAFHEARVARQACGILDASSLGKIEVTGPEAGRLLDFCFYNRISDMSEGSCRYAFMLGESGVIFDDAVVLRLAEHRFLVSASSAHVEETVIRLEEARQDRFNRNRVHITDLTQQFATLAITGPRTSDLVGFLGGVVDGMKHMQVIECRVDGVAVRVARVSFSGDMCHEISVASSRAGWLFERVSGGLRGGDGTLLGVEALLMLRAEKGYILVGKDTDGLTMPHDIGWGGPRLARKDEFIGKRSLFTESACGADRHQLVGLAAEGEALVTGAHIIEGNGEERSIGYVTSSCMGPGAGEPVAIGLLRKGRRRMGETVGIFNQGKIRSARVCSPCFLDPEGSLLRG